MILNSIATKLQQDHIRLNLLNEKMDTFAHSKMDQINSLLNFDF